MANDGGKTIPPLRREMQNRNGITINKQAFIPFITKLISFLLCFWLANFPEFESRSNFGILIEKASKCCTLARRRRSLARHLEIASDPRFVVNALRIFHKTVADGRKIFGKCNMLTGFYLFITNLCTW